MYIFDIEGTLSDCQHRAHLVPDWDAFHAEFPKDEPRKQIAQLYRILAQNNEVVILTGMMEKHREMASAWLRKYNFRFDELIMRPNDNFQTSPEFKYNVIIDIADRLLKSDSIHSRDIKAIFDDRKDVVDYLLNAGFPAIQV